MCSDIACKMERTALRDKLEACRLDLENAQAEHLADLRRIKSLQRKLDAQVENHADLPQAQELFDFWRGICNHHRAAFDANRKRLALARIREYRELGEDYMERLKNAIRGYSVDAFVKDGRRFDGFELIFRDAKQVELGEDRWRAHQRRQSEPKAVVAAIRAQFGEPIHDRVLDVFLTNCAVCGQGDGLYRPFQLRVNGKVEGSCQACGADIEAVKRVLVHA
jgi:hypothetical protein